MRMRIAAIIATVLFLSATGILFYVASMPVKVNDPYVTISAHEYESPIRRLHNIFTGKQGKPPIMSSGVLIEGNILLTTDYIFDYNDNNDILVNGKTVELLKRSPKEDVLSYGLAAFRVNGPGIKIASKDPKPGEEVIINAMKSRDVKGIFVKSNRDLGLSFIEADCEPGDGGGAILNSKGELVGIIWGELYSGSSCVVAISLDEIKDFIRDIK